MAGMGAMSAEFHPASLLFPLMDGVELAALVDDVRAHGLLEPIVMHEGKILDGRNRLRACEVAGVKPRFTDWDGGELTPTEWVVSMNLHRRHLTTAQRAALALDLLPHLEAEAKERQGARTDLELSSDDGGKFGEATEKAADLVGVGRSTVAAAKAIQKRDENGDIVNRMRTGELNVSQAEREAGFSEDPQVLDNARRDGVGRAMPPTYYGKGDKFKESTEPLRRYLKAWKARDYEFRHVNPREAAKRVRVLDELTEMLAAARADLATRDTPARMRV